MCSGGFLPVSAAPSQAPGPARLQGYSVLHERLRRLKTVKTLSPEFKPEFKFNFESDS